MSSYLYNVNYSIMIRYILKSFVWLLLTIILLQCTVTSILAQDINKEVYVVRPYEPTLSDAAKYNFLPISDELEPIPPHFEYDVAPKRYVSSFEPEPIKPARTVATSLPKIYKSWLKIGFGNYETPLAEFNISNLRSKNYALGASLFHKSSRGNLELINNHRVPAGYAINNINLYGKRFFNNASLNGNLRFDQKGFYYYGYNTSLFADSLPIIENNSIKQRTYLLGFDFNLNSTYTDSSYLNYKLKASYDYFWDKSKNNESNIIVEGSLDKNLFGLQMGLNLSVDNSKLNSALDTINNTILKFNPWISKRSADWKFMLGFELVTDAADISNFYLFPRANLDIIIIENILVPFIGLSGELQKNNYQQVFNENQFIVPGLRLKNTNSNLIAYAGLKGNISSVIRFRADVSYAVYKNMHFFTNDTLVPLQNQFTAVYGDVDLITYHGQFVVQPSANVQIIVDGNYYEYNVFEQEKPWHKPDFDVMFDAEFKFSSKFTLGTGFTVTGNRWIRNYQQPNGIGKIKPVADINLKLNYNYSRVFSLFSELSNIADRSYMIWNQYPSQRFNFLFGLTYKL
jgi:hypothetical protein